MTHKIKWKYLSIIFGFILVSVVVQTINANIKHQKHLESQVQSLGVDAHLYFQDLIEGLTDKYLMLSLHYAYEPHMTPLMQTRNHAGLLSYVQADYDRLRSMESNLHTMHFIAPDNHTILRLHQLDQYGDDLTEIRPIVRDVNREKIAMHGFEVGKNGITYRITTPLINQKQEHLGVLEFGVRPNYFVEKMVDRFNVESMILVESTSLGKLQTTYGFEGLNGFSIIQQTPLFKELASLVNLKRQSQLLNYQGRTYLVLTSLDQPNHKGEVVSKVVIATDITDIQNENQHSLLAESILNLLVLLFLWMVIYIIFSRYTFALENSYDTIQALHLKSHQLRTQANTDELTGLYNRRFFNESLQKMLDYGQTGTLLFFDIDHFKQLNDAHGHQVGDEVLVEFAHMLTGFFRQDDLIVRWGGEEFAVFINNMPEAEAYQKAERFRQFVETSSNNHQPYVFTISGGVAAINSTRRLDDAFKLADARLYQAKETGRNQIIGSFNQTTRPADKEV
ncbi:MAG: diguanylate cyclase [Thiomicrospira sp.]|uniref:sensor domain-containing diguanylate cyclase n=1 Tax=Thiomicrospira sp. TaxID=935 RepID=UPI0019D9AC1E|nr:diguanylate cyclase [Thiomicrospira sp.]MBE0493272.1 diguanylate cyclase [Thiomicrospira sp.]